ncbi:MAG TPA: amidohydrolase family protein, partial [Duganella sp.]|uniref:amidohydrolase family protein n=1 Tax=Duganella sp. TaxID=1904440 RepID=UPI002ED44A52
FGSTAWRALLAELRQRRLLVEVHQQACGLRALLEPLLAAGLAVVVDHFGRPDPALGIDDPGFRYLLSLGASGRVWVKLSAAYRNGAAGAGERSAGAAVPLLLEHYGLGHLVWGSDWPHTLFERSGFYRMQQRLLDEWLPDEAQRRQVLHDTPAKLFSFDR